MQSLDRLRVRMAGAQVAIDCVGIGTPTLMFVHGGFCDRQDWSAQREALAGRFRVVTFDLPGHGESALPAAKGIEPLVQAAHDVVARYGEGSAILVGHSLGCRIVLEVFRRARRGILGLVLIEGRLVPPEEADRVARIVAAGETDLIRLLQGAFAGMFVAGSDPALRERVVSRLVGLDLDFAQNVLLSSARWSADEAAQLLASIEVPVLALQSTYADNFARKSLEPGMTTPWMDLIAQQVPAAELHVVPGVGHFPQIESADTVSEHIARFARRCVSEQVDAGPQ